MIKKYIVLIVLLSMSVYAASQPITLKKMYHHVNDKPAALEITKTVFYFDKAPRVIRQDTQVGNKKKTMFLVEDTAPLQGNINQLIKDFNTVKNRGYEARIDIDQPEGRGIRISFVYDPKMVAFEHDTFDAITTDKGVLIRAINKKLLQQLQEQGRSILQTAAYKPQKIIIDCGHGGSDSGTIGVTGFAEKELAFAIGTDLKKELQEKGFSVFMTRSSDTFIPLDERTKKANAVAGADLFISIHGNSAPSKNAQGIETFCTTGDLFKNSNQSLINSALQERGKKSLSLAHTLQRTTIKDLEHHHVVDRHVKKSVSQVLLGVDIPAVLVEVGFLSHHTEGALLATQSYQHEIAQSLSRGISSYCSNVCI